MDLVNSEMQLMPGISSTVLQLAVMVLPFLSEPLSTGAIDRNPPQGVMLLDEKK